MISIGLTGGIGSGKSTVADMLAQKGALVFDADRLAHETYEPGRPGFTAVLQAFGKDVAGADGRIDRKRLGAIVFEEPARLQQLTDIVWPLVAERVRWLKHSSIRTGTRAFVLEAAVLFAAEWNSLFDEVWLVRAPDDAIRTRLAARDLDIDAIEARMAARRLPEPSQVTVVIDNDRDIEALARRVDDEWEALLRRQG